MTLPNFGALDLTVLILTYGRPQCLLGQLRALAAQTYAGPWELLLWNNNPAIATQVEACARAVELPQLTCIHSGANFVGRARFAVAQLARGRLLLLCDDDVLPGERFIADFVSAYSKYGPRVVVCGSGHMFRPHSVPVRETMRYFDLSHPYEGVVHFAHASTMLTSVALFREATHIPMARPDYVLVDDLWLSYVWGVHLGVPLIKIRCDARWDVSAKDPRIALHQNPIVQELQRAMLLSSTWPRDEG